MEPSNTHSQDNRVVQSSDAVHQAYTDANISTPSIPTGTTSQSSPQAISTAPPVTAQTSDETAIEQEWIEKAKEVVARTQDDPYMQNRLLSELKTQYLATRYGRVSEVGKHK